MITIAIIAGALALVLIVVGIVRWGNLPAWSHRDVLAFVALLATIGGAIILTLQKWVQTDKFNEQADRLITEIVRERPTQISDAVGQTLSTIIDAQTWTQKLDSAGIIVVLLSLGLVISARTLKGKIFGSEFEMGSGEAQRAAAEGARQTAEAASDQANEIAAQAAPLPPAPDAAPTSRP
jgi:hypothetical protein